MVASAVPDEPDETQHAAEARTPPEPAPTPADEASHDATGLELARAMTRAMRSSARARSASRRAGGSRRGTQLSGAHPGGRDPALIGDVVDKLVTESGWSADLAVHGVFGRWEQIVGAEVAEHCRPESFSEGRLRVRTDSTAWATQLRLLAPTVVKRLNEELGHDTVTLIDVAGPDAPSWTKGRRSARDGRGPRDTYG